ncbi:MAG TPA: alpha/beta hydrolase, partial [Anaerolineae bacterium]
PVSCNHRSTMPVLSVNSIELHYLEAGSGQPVLLLHGLGSCGDDWFFQTPILAERGRHVIAPDLRGHGQSSNLRGPISVTQLAADIAGLMDGLGLASAHIVGLSLGGLVGQQLAIDFPQKVQRLILTNTFAHLWPTSLRELYTLLRRAIVSRLLPLNLTAQVVAADLFPRPDQSELRQAALDRVQTNDLTAYRSLIGAIRRFDTRRSLHRIHAPTLVITGDRDRVVPRGCQLQLVRGIPNVRWQMVRDSGHATPIDQPEEFNRLVLEFLKE